MRDPYRSGVELYDRRPRRPGELADHGSLTELRRTNEDEECPATPAAIPPPPNLTTVSPAPQEGGILPTIDCLPTQG